MSAAPLVGSLGTVYYLFLVAVGVREQHRVTTGRAVAIVLVPVAAAVLLFVALVAVIFVLIAASEGGVTAPGPSG